MKLIRKLSLRNADTLGLAIYFWIFGKSLEQFIHEGLHNDRTMWCSLLRCAIFGSECGGFPSDGRCFGGIHCFLELHRNQNATLLAHIDVSPLNITN